MKVITQCKVEGKKARGKSNKKSDKTDIKQEKMYRFNNG